MRISDWSSDVCSSDLNVPLEVRMGIGRVVMSASPRCLLHLTEALPVALKAVLQDDDNIYVTFGVDVRVISIRSLKEDRSEEHTSKLQSLMRNSYAVC